MQALTIHWSTSRGRDTYQWPICRLTDTGTGKHYRTCGGGYDRQGTVIGNWLADVYQDRLQAIADRAGASHGKGQPYTSHKGPSILYGMTRNDDTGRVTLDGACGFRSMELIAEAIGIRFSWFGTRRGSTLGYNVTDMRQESAE